MPGFDIEQLLRTLSIALIPGLFAITLHEVSHGWAAKRLGDPTAFMLGRLSLNPLKHIDPIGTVVVPIAMLLMSQGQMAFGWAKPVPVAFGNLRQPRRDMILVAAAGPSSNLLMATGWASVAAVLLFMSNVDGGAAEWLLRMCVFGIQINVILAVFNMLPIPPLDGGRVLSGLLPPPASRLVDQIEPFGFVIVIALMVTGVLWTFMEPFMFFFIDFYFKYAGLG